MSVLTMYFIEKLEERIKKLEQQMQPQQSVDEMMGCKPRRSMVDVMEEFYKGSADVVDEAKYGSEETPMERSWHEKWKGVMKDCNGCGSNGICCNGRCRL